MVIQLDLMMIYWWINGSFLVISWKYPPVSSNMAGKSPNWMEGLNGFQENQLFSWSIFQQTMLDCRTELMGENLWKSHVISTWAVFDSEPIVITRGYTSLDQIFGEVRKMWPSASSLNAIIFSDITYTQWFIYIYIYTWMHIDIHTYIYIYIYRYV